MSEAAPAMSSMRRALTTAVIMSAALMVVIDATIANVALPHMQAALSATPESIAWVLTSYMLATAIAIPVTGWLTARFGTRTLFTVAAIGFALSSALCGIANSLPLMVAARVLQGIFGAFMLPLSQTILYDINPPEKHLRAMTIWGMGIMIGPVLGPTLGGWLTESWSWHWVFFINVPIGIVASIGTWLLLAPAPVQIKRFDFTGFLLLATALASFQLMLDRGTHLDWFESPEIIIEAGLALAASWMFVVHTTTAAEPLIPRALFRDRNLMSALVLVAVASGIMFANAALFAPLLQRLLGYPVLDSGMVIMPRGLGTMAGMMLAGRLLAVLDARIVIALGFALNAYSLHMMTGFNLEMDARPIVISGVIQGLGIGLSMLPMNLLALATLSKALRTDAASLYSLTRSLGAAVAISIGSSLVASNVQTAHQDIGSNVTAVTLPFLSAPMVEQLGLPTQGLLMFIDDEVNRQGLMIAYLDDFWLMMWAAILAMPLVFFMNRGQRDANEPIMAE